MSVRHPALRIGASLVAGLLIAATLSGAVAAVASSSPWTGAGPRSAAAPAAPAAVKKLKFDPQFKYRAAERRVPVNVRSLARKEPKVRPSMTLPHLGRPTSSSGPTGSKPSGTSPKIGVAATLGPVDATTNTDGPAAQTGFAGLAESSGPDTGGEPPDPWVAVGPEHVVQAVNLTMKITDRQGGNATSVSLADFFELPLDPVTFNSDPHVIYDSLHGRWLATEVSWDCDTSFGNAFGTGYIDFAVSRTSDPTGVWDRGFIFWADQLPDFPAPGTSTDKVGIANNLFDMTQTETTPGDGGCVSGGLALTGGDMVYMDWADLIDGGAFDAGELPLGPGSFSPRVAVQVPATTPAMQHVVGYDDGLGGLGVLYFTVTGSIVAGTGDIGASYDLSDDGVMAPWLDPPQPQQPGSDTIDSAVDGRPTDAIWQDDRFVTVSTYPCGTGPRDCVRVTELETTNVATTEPTLTQDFLVSQSGKDLFMGGVGLTGNGALHVAWTRSSSSDAPSSYGAHQSIGDAADSISAPELLASGTGAYAGERWGDYVGVAQDPQVPSQAWNGNQYSGTTEWRTRITPLRTDGTTYVPIAPFRVLDTRVPTGLSGKFKAGIPRTWQVTNGAEIPDGAVAVTGNVTITKQTAAGYVSVTVTPTNSPPSSTINFPLGENRANNVTIPLSSTGTLSAVYKAKTGKTIDLLFDVTGYFLADDSGTTYNPLTEPVRLLNTRDGVGPLSTFKANIAQTLVVGTPTGPIPETATAVTGNLAMVKPTKAGYASVTKDPTNSPATSTINFPAGATMANGVFAPLDTNHSLSIVYKAASGATTNVIFDVTGYFEPGTAGLRFVPLNPSRIVNTRAGAVLSGLTGMLATNVPKTLAVEGHWGVPVGALAVTGNLTVTAQTGAGYLSVTPTATTTPATSTINFPLGDTRANGIVAPLSGTGSTSFVYKASSGKKTDILFDLSGYFE